MSRIINRPRSRRSPILAWLVALAVLVGLVWLTLKFFDPIPPRSIAMATGPIGSPSHEFGLQYQQVLERSGIDLRLQPTAGGSDNLALLRDPSKDVSVGFVEYGLVDAAQSEHLESLGTVSIAALWTFVRAGAQDPSLQGFRGKRIAIEPQGSGTHIMVRRILALNGLDSTAVELRQLPPEQAAEALIRGEVEGAFLLSSWRSPVVQKLLVADGIVLAGHPRADAYVALSPNLVKVRLPMGIADFERNIPPAPVELLAVETALVVREDLHPALQYLLLEAASEIHSGRDIFQAAGAYPSPESNKLPLSSRARQYYKSGRPFVYRYFPFWLASLIEQLWVVMIPLFAVVYPLAGMVPRLYQRMLERRIYLLYGELKFLETRMASAGGDAMSDLEASLGELAKRANNLRVPLGYAQRLFILKNHIALAQQEVEKRRRSHG